MNAVVSRLARSKPLVVPLRATLSAAAVWIRIFPDKPISSKPAEVRMGNGKGNPEYWVALVQPGRVLYEMDGVEESLAREAFCACSR